MRGVGGEGGKRGRGEVGKPSSGGAGPQVPGSAGELAPAALPPGCRFGLTGLTALTALTVLTVLTVLTAPLEAQVRGVLVEELRPGQRAPALVLPYATAQGVAAGGYDLGLELGRVVVLGFCPDLTNPGCGAFWRWSAGSGAELGPAVSLVMVAGAPAERVAEFAAREGILGRVLADDRTVVARRWGVQPGDSGRIGVFVVSPEGAVAYRDLQFDPDDLHGRGRLETAVRTALGGQRPR